MIKFTFPLVIFLITYGCESFVEKSGSSLSYVNDEDISNIDNISFLSNGVKNDYSRAHGYVSLWADLLSDVLVNDGKVQGSTDVRGEYLDNGYYDPTVGSYAGPYQAVAQSWRSAKSLKDKLDDLYADPTENKDAYHLAYLYQGLSCYLLGTYFGRGPSYPTEGGATLNESPFIPTSDLYTMALSYFDSASAYAGEYDLRVINSLIGRLHLYSQNYTLATTHALMGLQENDIPLEALPGLEDPWPNWYWYEAGNNRTRYTLDSRFKLMLGEDFIDDNQNGTWDVDETFYDCAISGYDVGEGDGMYNPPDQPEEASRLSVSIASMAPETGYVRYFQTKYPDADTPIPIINWQENHLMLAELSIIGENAGISATDAINAVRAAYGISPLSETNLEVLIEERDKELFCQGQRLIDQNRFSETLDWHLIDSDTWHYLPIPYEEELANPNYP